VLRISKLADYGIAIAVRLAAGQGADPGQDAWRSCSELSRDTSIPEPTVGKLLRRLARSGLLEARRGPAGGYRLARPAEDISVAELLEALEGPLAVTDCVPGATGCDFEPHCDARQGWARIHDAVTSALHAVRLSEMVPAPRLVPLRAKAPASVTGEPPLSPGREP